MISFIDWLKEGKDLNDNRPRQTEFNKLNLSYTLMSKRNLLTLVKEGLVNGWDDPRMPTICGFRRRGYSPESIHKFIDKIGYTTYDALNDIALLESCRTRRSEQPCHPRICCHQPSETHHHQLSGRTSGGAGSYQQPGRSGSRKPHDRVQP